MSGGHSRSGWWWLAGGGLLVAAGLIAGGMLFGGPEAQKLTAIASLLTALAALVPSYVGMRRQRKKITPADREAALADLAEDLRRQWAAEAAVRAVRRPAPIRVRWSATGHPVNASPAAVLGAAAVPSTPSRLNLSGDVADVAAKYRKLPNRQLVVLGEPGGGKSTMAMLLVLDLLADREPADPVPFLVNLAPWHPGEALHDWLARQLDREHAGLGGRAECLRFLASGRVLPVLDGFDELPGWHQQDALAAIDEAVDGGKPLILTCRTREYLDLLTRTRSPLANAAVVELAPVTAEDVRTFLDVSTDARPRWQPVLDRIRAEPGGELALALSTPLMVSLARTVYAEPGTEPAELLALPDREAVQRHLLEAFVPSLYPERDPRYPVADVVEWLTVLACYLGHWEINGIAWWELHYALPRFRSWLLRLLHPGIPLGGLLGLAVGGAAEHWLDLRLAWLPGAAAGLALGLLISFRWPPETPRPVSDEGVRSARRSALFPASNVAVLVALVTFVGLPEFITVPLPAGAWVLGLLAVLGAGATVWVVSYGHNLREQPLDFDREPGELVRADRRYARSHLPEQAWFGLVGALLAVAGLLGTAHSIVGLGGLLVVYLCLSLRLRFASATFALTRWLMAADGLLPRDLLDFLHDAHQRGVLRRAGPFYEFRHALLQVHLAERRWVNWV
ncbi:NACHT domain-containing protein [Crossiella sp. CA-258035]|uniref:NACHT domain-containing protein n=1 Tax=Crossiella sp. CA-258035 TaxID=2981138 RepID=UPI0024BD2AB3|nr:NACHT domain-containing protein [Crossiella sp. CA-258035]WHT22829.1 NACHT domain-containing protein [Crossiella sp. CA-258035]